MIRRDVVLATVCTGLLALAIGCSNGSEDNGGGGTGTVSASQVVDVFNANCMPCHSGADAKEELELDTIAGLMAGSEHGEMVVPGDAAASHLIKSLRGDGVEPMPYKQDPLSEADIKLIEEWINAGASS